MLNRCNFLVRTLIVWFLTIILWLFPSNKILPAWAIDNLQTPTVDFVNNNHKIALPDWEQIAWENLPPVLQPGWIQLPPNVISILGYDPSRIWKAGQLPDSIVMLGDMSDAFHLEAFNLEDISSLTELALDTLTLDDFALMRWQTVDSLVKAIPELGNITAGAIEPLQDLLKIAGIDDFSRPLKDLIEQYSELEQLTLRQLDLSKYALDAIPSLSSVPIGKFVGWQQSFINQVPGLAQVPFSKFPIPLLSNGIQVAIADIVWSDAERGSSQVGTDYFISGSIKKDNTTEPVACEAGKPCAYLELSDLAGDRGSYYGKRWASGETQQVKGGFGLLAKVNNGWEPTGKLVYGPAFKVVLTETEESTGTANFGLYLRFCARGLVDLGCTPYFIGPIPWFPVNEKGFVIVTGTSAPEVEIPSQYQERIDALRSQYEEEPVAEIEDDCIGAVDGDLIKQILSAVPADIRSYATKPVPLILEKAKKYGVTDPAQIAYILATVQTETTMGANLVEGATRNKSAPGSIYYGRGYPQLTGIENYRKASRLVGIDLVKNPNLAADPEMSAEILVAGMRDGMFTGRKLTDFIGKGKQDFVRARQIVNDGDKSAAIAQDAERYLSAMEGKSITGELGDSCRVGVTSGSMQQRIYQAARQSYGMSSRSGPGGGNVACAWAVNKVLNKSGISTIGKNPNLVFSVRDALEAGRGQQISRSQASAGDLVLAMGSGSRQHIGICMNQGCTQVLSNSSSRKSFSWISDTDFSGTYGVPSKIYRVVK
jgi:predicted chitinase